MNSKTIGRKVLITGITGQTGSYLADLLLEEGCEVHGLVRRSSSFNRSRIEHLRSNADICGKQLFLHYSDLNDSTTIRRLLNRIGPAGVYRQAHGLFVCNGILYNHESPRRGENFVTKKIAAGAAAHARGKAGCLELGNLGAERDWGYALEYAQAMIRMLRHETPDDYVVATGTGTSVRDFAMAAYGALGMELAFEGAGVEEVGFERTSGKILVRVNPHFYRPLEPGRLVGDATKARKVLEWQPTVTAGELAGIMAKAEMENGLV